MVDRNISLSLLSIDQSHKKQDPRARSHRSFKTEVKMQTYKCKSQERYLFDHNHFTHSKIIKASHDIPLTHSSEHEHKHLHEDHSFHRLTLSYN